MRIGSAQSAKYPLMLLKVDLNKRFFKCQPESDIRESLFSATNHTLSAQAICMSIYGAKASRKSQESLFSSRSTGSTDLDLD